MTDTPKFNEPFNSGRFHQALAEYMWEYYSLEIDAWAVVIICDAFNNQRLEFENLNNSPEAQSDGQTTL